VQIVGKSSVAVPRPVLHLSWLLMLAACFGKLHPDARAQLLNGLPPSGNGAKASSRLSWRNIANVLVSPNGGL
jgi:hypothetical protein